MEISLSIYWRRKPVLERLREAGGWWQRLDARPGASTLPGLRNELSGHSLVIRGLGCNNFTAGSWVRFMVGELRCWKLYGTAPAKKLRNKTKQQLSEALLLFPRSSFLVGVCVSLHMYHPSLLPPPIFLLSALFCSLHFALFPSVSAPHLSLCNHTRAKSFVYLEVGAEKRSKKSLHTLKQRRGILYSLSWSKDDPSFLPLHKIHLGVYRPVS